MTALLEYLDLLCKPFLKGMKGGAGSATEHMLYTAMWDIAPMSVSNTGVKCSNKIVRAQLIYYRDLCQN